MTQEKDLDKTPHDVVPDLSRDLDKLGNQAQQNKSKYKYPAENDNVENPTALYDDLVIHGYEKDISEYYQGCNTYYL